MEKKQKGPMKKRILIAICILITLILGLFLSVFLIINNYINKMNLVNTQTEASLEASVTDTIVESGSSSEDNPELGTSPESAANPQAPDSSEADISAAENIIKENMQADSTPIMEDKDVFNILFIGSDTRKSGGTGRSDAMIVISINKKTKAITATSFLRDIYLQIPGRKNNRINEAYAVGGEDLLMDTLEQNFKLKINKYVSVDFYAFIDIVDAVGGVTLDVTDKEIPVINRYIAEINRLTGQELTKDSLTKEGKLLLNGKQALGYSRNRYVGNNDFERTDRQRRVLEQIFLGVKDLNLIDMNNLLNVILPQVTTNLTKGELFSLILSLPSYRKYELQQWRVPINGSYTDLRIRGMEVLGIDFEENINEIQSRIYGEKTK